MITGSVCSLAASIWARAESWEPYELRSSRTVLGVRSCFLRTTGQNSHSKSVKHAVGTEVFAGILVSLLGAIEMLTQSRRTLGLGSWKWPPFIQIISRRSGAMLR